MRRLVLDSKGGKFLAVRGLAYAELVCQATLTPGLGTGLGGGWCSWDWCGRSRVISADGQLFHGFENVRAKIGVAFENYGALETKSTPQPRVVVCLANQRLNCILDGLMLKIPESVLTTNWADSGFHELQLG